MTVRVNKQPFNLREKLSELERPIGLKGSELMKSKTIQEARNLVSAGRKNFVYNGAIGFNQRGNATGITGSGYYGPDRFYTQMTNSVSGTWSIGQSTDVPAGYGFQYSLEYDCTATSTNAQRYLMTIYRMEGYDSQVFNYGTPNAKDVTLSFWIKCSKAGDIQVNFENEENPDQGYQTKQTIHKADTWEKKVVTIPGDTTKAFAWTSAKAMCFDIMYSAFGTYASQTPTAAWSTLANEQRGGHCSIDLFDSTSNYVRITGVQLELGRTATEFDHRPYGEELALCKRYYQRMGDTNTNELTLGGYSVSGSTIYKSVQLPVEMRAVPTLTQVGSLYSVRANQPGSLSGHRGKKGFGLSFTTTGTGNYLLASNANAYYVLEAEI